MGRKKCILTEEESRLRHIEYVKKWQSTPKGRASHLLNSYKQSDKLAQRGECTLTAQYIVDNIFSKSCVHCGETDWKKLGCNRLDNSKPHTPDNVEPCCFRCNTRLPRNILSTTNFIKRRKTKRKEKQYHFSTSLFGWNINLIFNHV